MSNLSHSVIDFKYTNHIAFVYRIIQDNNFTKKDKQIQDTIIYFLQEKPWERKAATREWDLGKNDKDKEKDKLLMRRDERPIDKRRHRSPEKSPEPGKYL